MSDEGTLTESEYHPAADPAMRWFTTYVQQHPVEYMQWKEALASSALSDNRLAEVCIGTMDRLAKGEPVSDRYLLGLCWTLRDLSESGALNAKQDDTEAA